MLEEFSEVISRRHIARKYPKAAENAEILLDFLRAFAILVPGIPGEEAISPDRDDDFVLACAIDGKADCIASGDPHLLDLKSHRGIPILATNLSVFIGEAQGLEKSWFPCIHGGKVFQHFLVSWNLKACKKSTKSLCGGGWP